MSTISEIRSIISLPATHTSLAVRQVEPSAHDQAVSGYAGDETSLSGTGGLVSAALNLPDVRYDKIADLQQRIADGTYNVSASDVAGRLVDSLLG